jgi:hypothetical protein
LLSELQQKRPAKGRDPIFEKQLRHICAVVSWKEQRVLWLEIKSRT